MVLPATNQTSQDCCLVSGFLSALQPDNEALMPISHGEILKNKGEVESVSNETMSIHSMDELEDSSCVVLDEVAETFQSMMVSDAVEYVVISNGEEVKLGHQDDLDLATIAGDDGSTGITSLSSEEIEVVYNGSFELDEEEPETDHTITIVSSVCSDGLNGQRNLEAPSTCGMDTEEEHQEVQGELLNESLGRDEKDVGQSTSTLYTPLLLRIHTDTSAMEGESKGMHFIATNVWVPPPVCDVGSCNSDSEIILHLSNDQE
mmetsp:Transcript_9910/g.21584  ORF Transcript_9910/g.21584 Transcript_9910/m.21584 type:complete len:261 (+) Transcript_9910:121-903(+)